jgi:copper chaperone
MEYVMKFAIPDMSCGHCTATIEKTLKAAGAEVRCDLGTRTVEVSGPLSAEAVTAALDAVGFEAIPAQ